MCKCTQLSCYCIASLNSFYCQDNPPTTSSQMFLEPDFETKLDSKLITKEQFPILIVSNDLEIVMLLRNL